MRHCDSGEFASMKRREFLSSALAASPRVEPVEKAQR